MLLALGWWSYLLYIKNNDAFNAKVELLTLNKIVLGKQDYLQSRHNDPDYLELKKKYRNQEKMILGEAAVLAITLLIGIWLINNGYRQQTEAAQQSRNFLLSITHELKSPLASIKLILQTFKKRNLKQEQIELFSNNAINETVRLEKLVNNLLLAAKMETSYDIKIEEITLLDEVYKIKEYLTSQYSNADIRILIEKDTIISADQFGLNSILTNLIENALKYGGKPPSIEIKHKKDNYFDIISISDNGNGISPLEKKKIFDKFYRIGNEDTRETKGTGLGLYLTQQFINKHKGMIKINDNTPQGSIFAVYLPQQK